MATLYQRHVAKWQNCQRCGLCNTRQRVVFARGSVPADIVFAGEAPGESEDCLGLPFVGPAGKLLDAIVADALAPFTRENGYDGKPLRTAFCNLVGCIPRDEGGKKSGEPEAESIEACRPKLNEFLAIAKPRLIVCVGKLAWGWIDDVWKLRAAVIKIDHPAYILRLPIHGRGLAIQRATVGIRSAVEEMLAIETKL